MSEEFEGNALFPNAECRDTFMSKVQLLGIAHITIEFSGSGDSGDMHDPSYRDAKGEDISSKVQETMIAWPGAFSTILNGEWNETRTELRTTLDEAVKELGDKALEASGLDWYNNDGGQGQLEISFTPEGMDVVLNVGINYTNTEDHSIEF